MFVSWIIYGAHMIAALRALALAQKLEAVWHLHGMEVSVKRRILYKHLRDAFFPLSFISPTLSESWKGEYCMKGVLGSIVNLPVMLPCSFEDTCQWPHWNVFTKASGGRSPWTHLRGCPWNESERCQEACSCLPGQWARRTRSEKSIREDQLLLALKAPFREKCRNDTYFSFCSPHAVHFHLPVP